MKNLPVVLLLVLCLAACSQAQPQPSAKPTDTITPYQSPTQTVRSTRTQGSTRTRLPTLTKVTSTEEFVNLNDWPLPNYCAPSQFVRQREVSPDHQWLALNQCLYPDPTLTILNKNGNTAWNLRYFHYSNMNSPEDGLIVFETWSHDSRYAYFYTTGYFDPIGCYYNHGGYGLFRLDVQTGVTSVVLPLRPDSYPYIWSFSPTGRRLLYMAADSPISFLDLKNGALTELLPLPVHTDLGGFLWSPDGFSVAFTLMEQAVDGPPTYFLNLIDVNSASWRTLMTSQPNQCLAASSWLDENRLVVYTATNYSDEPGTEIELDIPSIP